MENVASPQPYPELLPPGTQVGPWRVLEPAGLGAHGAVYRAVRVALKLALFPGDQRFAREVGMLSRSHHPHLPRMIDHGEWEHLSGTRHPYIAMEWIDGVPGGSGEGVRGVAIRRPAPPGRRALHRRAC